MAMCYAPTWSVLQYKSDDYPYSGPDVIGYAHIPGDVTAVSGFLNAINKNAPNPELAYYWMVWLSSEETDLKMAYTQNANPIRKATYQDAKAQELNPRFVSEFDRLDMALPIPSHMIFEEEARIVSDWIVKYQTGASATAEDALKGMSDELTEAWAVIAENK